LSTGEAPAGLGASRTRGVAHLSRDAAAARLRSLAASPRTDLLGLGLGLAVITALNLLWVSLETRPPHWDKARHLTNSLLYRDAFGAGDLWGALTDYHTYPPLMYWVADAFYGVFRTHDAWAATFSQAVFLAVLAFSTYGLGRHLWSRRVGLLAAVFVVTSPMVVSQFKDFMLDAPLTAMTALGLYLLVRSEEFSRRGASAALGVACGLGMLTKWSFALSMALPLLVAGSRAGWTALAGRSGQRIVNLGLATVLAAAVCSTWYAANAGQAIHELGGNTNAAQIEGDPPVASVAGVLWYFWNLVSNQLFLLPFLLFAVGVVLLAFRADARKRNLYPALLVVGTYLAYAALVNKDDRYTEAMLPAVAVLATYWFESLRATARRWAATGLVAYGALTFAAISFGIGVLPGDAFVHLGRSCDTYPEFSGPCPGSHVVVGTQSFEPSGQIRTLRGIRLWSQHGYIDGPPSGEHWYQEEMFRTASRLSRSKTLYLASSGYDLIWFNGYAVDYFLHKYGITWVTSPDQTDFAAVSNRPGEKIAPPAGFTALRRYRLPDGGSLVLLTRAGAAGREPAATKADLEAAAREVGHAVYWLGRRLGTRLELRVVTAARYVYVRYLPAGVAVGDRRQALTVATYAVGNGYQATRAAAKAPGAVRVPARGGAVAFYDSGRPTSIYLAYPGSPLQIEVFDPSPARARAIVESGAVRPAG